MTVETYLPAERLKPFIKAFMIIESVDGMENRILPDTSIVMAVRYKGETTYKTEGAKANFPIAAITGIRKTARLIDYSKDTATLLVIFREGGAAAFFRESLHELFGISVSLDGLIHYHKVNNLEEQVTEAKNNRQRISIIERFFLSELMESRSDLLVLSAVEQIKSAHGMSRIQALATGLAISRDPFEKRFRRVIGTSPRQFSTIVRVKNLIEDYSPVKSLTDLALSAGYFDQAHFNKEFKSFTGQAPHVFFSAPPDW